MSEPCTEKSNIAKLFEYHEGKVEKLHAIELRQIEIQGNVSAIKKTIENGMSTEIKKTHDVVTRIEPIIAHHAMVITNIETMGWWISRGIIAALVGSVVGLILWAASNGYTPHT